MKKPPILPALRKAAKGLLFVSETDAPLEPFAWPDEGSLTEDRLRELAGAEPGAAVEQTELEGFFRTVPAEDREKFGRLEAVLRKQLADVTVYKVGDEAERQVYIVGRTPGGGWAGLKTVVVET